MIGMDRETGPAIDQAAIIETTDLYPRITSRHTFVGLATPLALEFHLQDNRTASDHRDMDEEQEQEQEQQQ